MVSPAAERTSYKGPLALQAGFPSPISARESTILSIRTELLAKISVFCLPRCIFG